MVLLESWSKQVRVLGPVALLCLLVATMVLANGAASVANPKASASAVTTAKFKKLTRQVAALQQQVDALARQPGPQGPPGSPGSAPACAGNGSGDTMVAAGAVCIDKYEASIWTSPTGGTQITGAIPCNANGQNCTNIFARSVPGVTPRASITWFQAQQALANVGKRLPTNAEWQQAVAGTPDPGTDNGTTDCNIVTAGAVVNTGSRSSCVSNFAANDMVGNLEEWVADWDEQAGGTCANWPAGFGTDLTCLGRADTEASTRFPGALIRGGDYSTIGTGAGPFAVNGVVQPSSGSFIDVGFRGAR